MGKSQVVGIFVAAKEEAKCAPVSEVQAIPGKGIVGDRTYKDGNDVDREITLIESEALDALAKVYKIELGPGESRRNLVTKGVALNHLIGKEFSVGECTLKGHRLCEPCTHLEGLTQPGVRKGLVHRGGLRAQIVKGGRIRVGDAVVVS